MTEIANVTAVPTAGGYYFDDKKAIASHAEKDGFSYDGEPITAGFDRIRQPADAVSVLIELTDGRVAKGECTAVQYSGFGGRDRVFDADTYIHIIESELSELFIGRSAESFEENINILLKFAESKNLHSAVRYGVSQALIDATATATGRTITEVIVDEYSLNSSLQPVPIYCQSGSDRRRNAEKMILKEVPILPHGLFNSVEETGENGERLRTYIEWLSERVDILGSSSYSPTFHIDVYGTIGQIFAPPYDRNEVVDYFQSLEQAARPYSLQIESPIEDDSLDGQIHVLGALRDALAEESISVDIIADEFCNTYDDVTAFVDSGAVDIVQIKAPDMGEITASINAIQYCEGTDTRAYLGGSCAETDVSARVCSHIALATQPIQILARPGMGVDEAYQIISNEMDRTIHRLSNKGTHISSP